MNKDDELVLVVKRQDLEPIWGGIKTESLEDFEKLIRKRGKFKRRGDVEYDPSWKQIIPYLIFKFGNKLFLMQRTDQGYDKRLHNNYSLGIGGHVNREDLGGKSIMDWAKREFEEEIEYNGSYKSRVIGLLNDESNSVGEVHTGYIILLEGDSDKINVKDEHKFGKLASRQKIKNVYNQLETWSKIVFDYLK